jgi:hypothetical protein
MTRVALIGLALAAALPAAGCMDTMAALREGRIAQTTKEAQLPQSEWTPLAGLQALFRHAVPQLPLRANPSNGTAPRFDRTPAEHPVQRSATRSKIPAQPAVLVAQSGTASRRPMPRRQSASGLPAKIPEQLPRLSHARTTAPIVPQAGPAPPAPSVGPLARPPAVAEPPRQQADPSAEEPIVTGSNPALAGSRMASVEAQKTPSTSPLRQSEPEGSVLYLVVRGEIRTVADLNGKPIALGAQEPAVEKAIKQAFAAAGVAPIFVGDGSTDALDRLAAREVVAALFLVGQPRTTELTDIAATLSQSDLRLLELPLDLPRSRSSGGLGSGSSTALPNPSAVPSSLPGSGLTTNPSAPASSGPGSSATNPSAPASAGTASRGVNPSGSPGLTSPTTSGATTGASPERATGTADVTNSAQARLEALDRKSREMDQRVMRSICTGCMLGEPEATRAAGSKRR